MEAVELFSQDLRGLGLEPGTIRVYSHHARHFMEGVEGEPGRHDVLRHLGGMREKSKVNSRKVAYYAIRALFDSMEIPFTVPPPKERNLSEVERPMLSWEQVAHLIGWVREEGDPPDQAYLALSTTYGLRRSELRGVKAGDIDQGDGSIMIWTKKGGEPRRHAIPDPIAATIMSFDGWGELCDSSASLLFKGILIRSGLPMLKGFGWHSVRRCLDTELIRNGVDSLVVAKFMRWSLGRSPLAMPMLYAQFTETEVDDMVFDKHPFLDSWR